MDHSHLIGRSREKFIPSVRNQGRGKHHAPCVHMKTERYFSDPCSNPETSLGEWGDLRRKRVTGLKLGVLTGRAWLTGSSLKVWKKYVFRNKSVLSPWGRIAIVFLVTPSEGSTFKHD